MKKVFGFIKLDILLALIMYSIICMVLYFVQYVWFGGALRTVFMIALVYPPAFLLGWLMRDGETKPEKHRKRIWVYIVSALATTLIAGGGAIYLIVNGAPLAGCQFFGASISVVILEAGEKLRRLPKISAARLTTAAYVSILTVTAVFLLIAKPAAINTAQKSLADEGYQNLSYVMHIKDEFYLNLLFGDKLPNTGSVADGLGVYLFNGDLDGKPFGILVDIASGKTILRDSAGENNILSGVIDMRGKD